MCGESSGGPGAPGQMGLEVKVSVGAAGAGQEAVGTSLCCSRSHTFVPNRRAQPAGAQCPCRALCHAKPDWGWCFPRDDVEHPCIPLQHPSLQSGSIGHVQAAAGQELPGAAGPVLGPFPRSHSGVPTQLPQPWVPGQARSGLVDAGSSAVLYGLRGLH